MPPGQGREFPRPCLECVNGARLQGLDPFLFSPPPFSRPQARLWPYSDAGTSGL